MIQQIKDNKIIYLNEKEIKDLCDKGYLFKAGEDKFLFLDDGFEDFLVKTDFPIYEDFLKELKGGKKKNGNNNTLWSNIK